MYPVTTTTPDITNAIRAHRLIPIKTVHRTAEMPPITSTIVYLAEIFSPQYLHLPLRLTHEIIGIRSFASSLCLQLVHMELPSVNCIFLGSLYMTTFKKEKMLAPIAKNMVSIKTLAIIIVTSSHKYTSIHPYLRKYKHGECNPHPILPCHYSFYNKPRNYLHGI